MYDDNDHIHQPSPRLGTGIRTTTALHALEEDLQRRRSQRSFETTTPLVRRAPKQDPPRSGALEQAFRKTRNPYPPPPPAKEDDVFSAAFASAKRTSYQELSSTIDGPFLPPSQGYHQRSKSARELIKEFDHKDKELLPPRNEILPKRRSKQNPSTSPYLPTIPSTSLQDNSGLAAARTSSNHTSLVSSASLSSVLSGSGKNIKNSFQNFLGVFSPTKRRERKKMRSVDDLKGPAGGFVVDRFGKGVPAKSLSVCTNQSDSFLRILS